MPELVLAFENRAELLEEYDKNLAHGRAFVRDAFGLSVFSPCTLTIEHPDTLRRQSFACEVVMVLQQTFKRDLETATQIMLKIHHEGRGVCGVYSKDVAATKVELVLAAARRAGHPLQCIMEAA